MTDPKEDFMKLFDEVSSGTDFARIGRLEDSVQKLAAAIIKMGEASMEIAKEVERIRKHLGMEEQ